jgi:hypothetical protein
VILANPTMTVAMPTPLSPEEIERLAIKRASAKMGWYIHACVYICVNGFFILRALVVDGARPWNVYPAMGWGLGLTLHFLSVFVLGQGSGLRERLVQRERDRLQREQNPP